MDLVGEKTHWIERRSTILVRQRTFDGPRSRVFIATPDPRSRAILERRLGACETAHVRPRACTRPRSEIAMPLRSLSSAADAVLMRGLKSLVASDRATT